MSGSRRACCGCGSGTPFDKCCLPGAIGYLIVEKVGEQYRLVGSHRIQGVREYETRRWSQEYDLLTTLTVDVELGGVLGSASLCDPEPIADGPYAGYYRALQWELDGTLAAPGIVLTVVATPFGGGSISADYSTSGANYVYSAVVRPFEVQVDFAMPTGQDSPYDLDEETYWRIGYQHSPLAPGVTAGVFPVSGSNVFLTNGVGTEAIIFTPAPGGPSGTPLGATCFDATGAPGEFDGSLLLEITVYEGSIYEYVTRYEATLTYDGLVIPCGAFTFEDSCATDPEPPAPPPRPECCPTASGWSFTDDSVHVHGVQVDIRRYAGTSIREFWEVFIIDEDAAPPLFGDCAGSNSGETVVGSSGSILARKWTYDGSGDPPVLSNIRVIYSASLGEDAAHPSGARSILTVYRGTAAVESELLLRLTHESDGTITRQGTAINLTGLRITQGESGAIPAGPVPFWTNLVATIESVGGLLSGAGSNWSVIVGHAVQSVGHSKCPASMALAAPGAVPPDPTVERHVQAQRDQASGKGGCCGKG
jgi:hypothetical protein